MTDRFDAYQRGELRRFLVANFNERELQSLFDDLGLEYDRLPGSGTENKARELIAYYERRQELDQLIAAIRRERPFFDPRGLDMLDNGADLFVQRSPGETYYPLADLIQPIVTVITTRPGYHVIEAEMGMGKTALIGYLWHYLRDRQRPVILYLFDRTAGRTQVSKAIRSVYAQIEALLTQQQVTLVQRRLPESQNMLQGTYLAMVGAQLPGLTILLDGIDACDNNERPLLQSLLPSVSLEHVTFVLTLRSSLQHHLLRHLSDTHILDHQRIVHGLPLFNQQHIATLLRQFDLPDQQGLVTAIYQQSEQGKLRWISRICRKIRADAPSYPVSDLAQMIQTFVLDDSDRLWSNAYRETLRLAQDAFIVRQVWLILALARSGLRLEDLSEVIGCDKATLNSICDLMVRYLPRRQNEEGVEVFALTHTALRILITTPDTSRYYSAAEIDHARQQLWEWVDRRFSTYRRAAPRTSRSCPLYVLKHIAEYSVEHQADLGQLFAWRGWLEELEERTRSRSACIDAMMCAWRAIQALFDLLHTLPIDEVNRLVVNLIACAMLRTSLNAHLLPELVMGLVAKDFWTDEQARDYAASDPLLDNQRAISTWLDHDLPRPDPPLAPEPTLVNALERLTRLPYPSEISRKAATRHFVHTWEQYGSNPSADNAAAFQLETLFAAFNISDAVTSSAYEPTAFADLLDELRNEPPPPTGLASDPYFSDRLVRLAEAWQQMDHWQRGHLVMILDIIIRVSSSYTDLLDALTSLAPAIAHHFPQAIPGMCRTIEHIVTSWHIDP